MPDMKAVVLAAGFFSSLAASFSLNITGPDWDYNVKDLADTTSDACKDAFSATIDCDDTLVGLVASMRPAFDPTSDDLDRICTDTCQSALKNYVANVQAACGKPGDGANIFLGGASSNIGTVPVDIVGEIFQYTFAKACRQSPSGSYCYFDSLAMIEDVTCVDSCDVTFYEDAHNYPGSAYTFDYYYLVEESSWWEGQFTQGWKKIQHCSGVTDLVSTSTTTTSHPSTKTEAASVISVDASSTTTTASASVSTSTSTSVPTAGSNTTSSDNSTATTNTGSNNHLSLGAMGWIGMTALIYVSL